jgi:hypothetical protein
MENTEVANGFIKTLKMMTWYANSEKNNKKIRNIAHFDSFA